MGSKNNCVNGMLAAILSVAVHAVIIFAFGGFDAFLSKTKYSSNPPPADVGAVRSAAEIKKTSHRVEEPPRNEERPRVADSRPDFKIYVVRPGDNLTRIAEKDGSTFEELAELNGTTVKKLSRLQVGQKIKLKNAIQ